MNIEGLVVAEHSRPESFFILMAHPDGSQFLATVCGEEVFSLHGYRFFIRCEQGECIVSDARCGKLLSRHHNLYKAIELAIGRIILHWPKYISQIKSGGSRLRPPRIRRCLP